MSSACCGLRNCRHLFVTDCLFGCLLNLAAWEHPSWWSTREKPTRCRLRWKSCVSAKSRCWSGGTCPTGALRTGQWMSWSARVPLSNSWMLSYKWDSIEPVVALEDRKMGGRWQIKIHLFNQSQRWKKKLERNLPFLEKKEPRFPQSFPLSFLSFPSFIL